jgi:hypothetical protein
MPRFAPESIETLDFIPANNSILNKLQSSNDLIYLTGATEDAIRGNFHTIAHQSWGVQSSTRNGGLKKDLSLLFEMDEKSWKDSDFRRQLPHALPRCTRRRRCAAVVPAGARTEN